MNCIQECPSLNIFAKDGCKCVEEANQSNMRGDNMTTTVERRAGEPQTAAEKTLTVSQYPKGQTDTKDLPFSDPKCGARWSGHNTSHCQSCHLTFAGVSGFDKHRATGDCVHPATVGLTINPDRNGKVWSSR